MMVDFSENSCGACEGSVPQHTALPTAPAKPPSPPRNINLTKPSLPARHTSPCQPQTLPSQKALLWERHWKTPSHRENTAQKSSGERKKKKKKNEAKCFLNSQEAITALQV